MRANEEIVEELRLKGFVCLSAEEFTKQAGQVAVTADTISISFTTSIIEGSRELKKTASAAFSRSELMGDDFGFMLQSLRDVTSALETEQKPDDEGDIV